MDGAGFFDFFREMILPLSIPGFAVTSIWEFTQVWNESPWGITMIRHTAKPITVWQAISWNVPLAGSILAALPILAMYNFLENSLFAACSQA